MHDYLIEIDSPFEADALAESTTLTVNEEEPLVVGMPAIVLVLELSESPFGSEPLEIDEVYGGLPPLILSAAE